MNLAFPIFAAAADLGLSGPTKGSRMVASDLMLILTLGLLIFGIFIGYVVFIRGSKSEIQIPSRRVHKDEEGKEVISGEEENAKRRKKKRMRRRQHRQRNPTLSQTGGLPASRDPEQSSPTS